MNLVAVALDSIRFARAYTDRLLAAVPGEDWFRLPTGGVTTIAWQVGHLAMAEYRLALERIRGRQPGDEQLIDDDFLHHFGRESVADPDPDRNPRTETIRAVFDRVHQAVVGELGQLAPEELALPPLKPHSLCKSKQECLMWCGHHEMLHAGQIGLLRRQLGQTFLW